MTKVLAFGSFDKFHKGHQHYLTEARKLGDELVVIVAKDVTIKKVKGHTPRDSEATRLANVSRFPVVNEARLGYAENYFRVLDDVKPDIVALGYDQRTFATNLDTELRLRGLQATITRISAFQPETYKSSKL